MQRVHIWTAICFVAFAVTGVSINLLGSTLGSLSLRYEIPLEDAGIFGALQALAATPSFVIFGWLLDRRDPRWVLCGASLTFCAGALLLGYAPTLSLALTGSLLIGIGFGGMLTGPNYVIGTLYGARGGSALNALNVFFSLGAISSSQIAAFALRQGNFSIAYLVAGVLMLALTLPLASIQLAKTRQQKDEGGPISFNYLSLIPFVLLFFTYIGSEVGFATWIFTQLTTAAQATVEISALATSLFWAGNMLGRIGGTIILRWMADEVLLPLTIVIIIIGVSLLLAFQTNANVSIIAAMMVGFGCGPVFPTTLGIVRKAFPSAHGTASGIVMGLGNFGAIVVPWLQGQVGGGNSGGMQVTLALALVTLATAAVIHRRMNGEAALQMR